MKETKFYLRKKDANGVATIYIYASVNAKQLYCSTGLKIKEADWSKARQKSKTDEEINKQLETYSVVGDRFINQCVKGITYTNEDFKTFLQNNLNVKKPVAKVGRKPMIALQPKEKDKPTKFFDVIDKFIADAPNRLNSNGEKICSRRVQMYVYDKIALQKFQRKIGYELTFEDFDTQTLMDFQTFLTNKNLKNNTVVRYFKLLKVFFRYAEDVLNLPVNQAFRKFKIHQNKKDVVVLNENEINQIWDYVAETECERNVVKLFLLGLHTGLRFGDYSTLTAKNINFNDMTISTIQNKTGQRVTIPLHPRLAQMLQNESLPRTISNEKFNKYIHLIMKKIGFNQIVEIKSIVGGKRRIEYKEKWELISSHTARRSFATNLYKAGINPAVIMMCTGHKDLDTFMKYVVLDEDDKLQIVRNLWNTKNV